MVHLVISLPLKSVLIYYGIAFNALCDQAMTEMKYSSWKTELICDFIKSTCRLCKCVQYKCLKQHLEVVTNMYTLVRFNTNTLLFY